MQQKYKKDRFLSMLLGTLCANLLGNLLTGGGELELEKTQLEQARISNVA